MKTSNRNREKTILVTGSSRGIGRGIAVELAAQGFSVAVNYAGNEDAARETLKLCSRAAPDPEQRFDAFRGDISRPEDRASLISAVLRRFGDFHGLVNNAGVAPRERRDLLDMGMDSFDRLVETNLKGSFFLSQGAAKHWLSLPAGSRGFRSLLFITSVSSEMISLNRGEYCIAKAGLSMAAQLFAGRLAPEGIGVYELRPGIIQTDMTGPLKEKYDALIAQGLVPQKRWGRPEDVGRAAASLVKGDFAYSPGTVIHVDGGLHIPRI